MSNHDLSDVFSPAESKYFLDQIPRRQTGRLRAESLGQAERFVNLPLTHRVNESVSARFNRNRQPRSIEAAGQATSSPHHRFRQRVGSNADQDPLRRRPGALDCVLAEVFDHLVIDPVRRAAQRQFPQGGQIPRLEEIVGRSPRVVG